jgi:hypothetical protein
MNRIDLPVNDGFTLDDWDCVLTDYYTGAFSVYDGCRVQDVTVERIARVDAWKGDSPDGYGSVDFAALVELAEGSWAGCMAWADTTGWDCQSGVQWKWANTRDDVISQGLDRDARARLGVPLAGE